jgi:hypothetical protein
MAAGDLVSRHAPNRFERIHGADPGSGPRAADGDETIIVRFARRLRIDLHQVSL